MRIQRMVVESDAERVGEDGGEELKFPPSYRACGGGADNDMGASGGPDKRTTRQQRNSLCSPVVVSRSDNAGAAEND